MILRDYQQRVLDDLVASVDRATLAVMPTGSGKTPVIAALARETPGPVLIAAHRIELINQAGAKLAESDVPHGFISPDHPHTTHRVQVAAFKPLPGAWTDCSAWR